MGFASVSFAQETVSEVQDRMITEERERQDFDAKLRETRVDLRSKRLKVPSSLPEDVVSDDDAGPAFLVRDIVLEGASKVYDYQKSALFEGFLNEELSLARIDALVKRVTLFYYDRGYITTRVYLPKQSLSSGKLVLKVVEGTVEGFEVVGVDKALAKRFERLAFSGLVSRILNINELEARLNGINRLRSQRAKLKLVPGETFGGTVVRVLMAQGSNGAGYLRYGSLRDNRLNIAPSSIDVSYDQLLGVNDSWFFNYSQSHLDRLNFRNSVSGGSSFGFRAWQLDISYSQFDYMNLIQVPGSNFSMSGGTVGVGVKASKTLVRDFRSGFRWGADFGVSTLDTVSFIEDTVDDVTSYKLTRATFGTDFEFETWLGHWSFRGEAKQGVNWFGATELDGSQHIFGVKESTPKPQFSQVSSSFNWTKNLAFRGEYISSQLSGFVTRSNETLYSADRVSIGGYSSVRGFDSSFQGEDGAALTHKLTMHLTPSLQLIGTAGVGVVRERVATRFDSRTTKISGISLGLRYAKKSWTVDTYMALPLKASSHVSTSPYITYFSFTKQVF